MTRLFRSMIYNVRFVSKKFQTFCRQITVGIASRFPFTWEKSIQPARDLFCIYKWFPAVHYRSGHSIFFLSQKLTDMAQKLSILVFLVLFSNPTIAFPAAFTRRGLLWDDSAWQDGIVGVGAAGIGILNQLWNQLTVPDPKLRSLQDQEPSEPEPPNTPDPQILPLYQPSGVEQCANSGFANKKRVVSSEVDDLFAVSQDPGTG